MKTNDFTNDDLYLEALALEQVGAFAAAKRLAQEVIRLEPTYGKAYYLLGKLYHHHMQDYAPAEQCYLQALQYDATYAPTYEHYVLLLLKSNRVDDAEQLLMKHGVAEKLSETTRIYLSGQCLEARGILRHAIKQYRQALSMSQHEQDIMRCSQAMARIRHKRRQILQTLLL